MSKQSTLQSTFSAHAILAICLGFVLAAFPGAYLALFVSIQSPTDRDMRHHVYKITYGLLLIFMRFTGLLLASQGAVMWQLRTTEDPDARRRMAQAGAVQCSFAFVILGAAQHWSEMFTWLNWGPVAVLLLLALIYGSLLTSDRQDFTGPLKQEE